AQNVVGAKMDGVWGPDSDKRHTATVKRVQEAIGVTADGIYGTTPPGRSPCYGARRADGRRERLHPAAPVGSLASARAVRHLVRPHGRRRLRRVERARVPCCRGRRRHHVRRRRGAVWRGARLLPRRAHGATRAPGGPRGRPAVPSASPTERRPPGLARRWMRRSAASALPGAEAPSAPTAAGGPEAYVNTEAVVAI